MPHTLAFWNGSDAQNCGYGEVDGLSGVARSGLKVSGQNPVRSRATTVPLEFLTVSRTKSRKPLAAAEVVVEEVEGNPGYYTSKFFLRPHYQLEGLTVSLRLVSKLPSAKGGK